MINFSKYNPYPNFRQGQEKAIGDMLQAYDKGNKVINLSAPTASGKTIDLFVFGQVMQKEYSLEKVCFTSPQVSLIEQGNLFTLPKLVGKRNYKCLGVDGCTAEDCPFTSKETGFTVCEGCTYRAAKSAFKSAKFGATTFARFSADPSIHTETSVLLVDESTNLEQALLDKATLELKLAPGKSIKDKDFDLKVHLQKRYDQLAGEVKHYAEQCKTIRSTVFKSDSKPSAKDIKSLKHVQKDYNHAKREQEACGRALHYLACNVPYVLTSDTEFQYNPLMRRKEKTIVDHFKLLSASMPFIEMVKPLECIVLASGTPTTDLITHDYFDVQVPHPIAAERRQVFYEPVGPMNKDGRYKYAKPMAEKIAQLHSMYFRSTLVHCGNYELAHVIEQTLRKPVDNVFVQEPEHRNEILNVWMDSDNSVFLSIAMSQGLDLPGEKYPLNVIAKLPFPNLGDQWIAARNIYDSWNFYNCTTAIEVQQACGRTTRGPDDFSSTYILDASFGSFFGRARKFFLPWFVESLKM